MCEGRRGSIAFSIILYFFLALLITDYSIAGKIHYIYDGSGKISKVASDSGEVKYYRYDRAGNLIGIDSFSVNTSSPVLQSITPDYIFLGQSGDVTIKGSNLLTLKRVFSDNHDIVITNYTSTDTEISFHIEVPSFAKAGQINIEVETVYGSAKIGFYILDLVLSKRIISLESGNSDTIYLSTSPGYYRDLTFSIINPSTDIVSLPASITVPAYAQTALTINALSNGVDVIDIGGIKRFSVFVSPRFAGSMDLPSAKVSVSIGQSSSLSSVVSEPVSLKVQKDFSVSGTVYSKSVSISKEKALIAGSLSASPVSVINEKNPLPGSFTASPVSIEIEKGISSGMFASIPISVEINKEVINGTNTSSPVSVVLRDSFTLDGAPFTAEAGTVETNHEWKKVDLLNTYVNPIVIVKPLSKNDDTPAVVRVRNVTSRSFELRIQEWNYLDGWHVYEKVSFLVIEAGHYVLPDGKNVEASIIETDRTGTQGNFEQVNFLSSFQTLPIVITSVMTYNGGDTVTTRNRNVSNTGFEVVMQEQESYEQSHTLEKIGYIAWESDSNSFGAVQYEVNIHDNITDEWTSINYGPFERVPVVLMDMQTTNGGDTANLRYINRIENGISVQVCEEQSRDTETGHTFEQIGYIVLIK